MMKYNILLLGLMLTSCHHNHEPATESPFVIRTYKLKLAECPQEVFFVKGRYYCLLASGKFMCLNRQFELDSAITQALSHHSFDYGFLRDDQLWAAKRPRDTFVEKYFLDQHFHWQKVGHILPYKPIPDEEPFRITECCVGEFGGAIFFEDKKNKRVYSCPATCVAALNKIGGHYYLTNYSVNAYGSELLFIENPKKLYELKADNIKISCNWWTEFVNQENDFIGIEKFEIGTTKLLDTIGFLAITSFVKNGELYHLCSDQNRSFLGKIKNGSMQMLDSIFTENLWRYRPVSGAKGGTILSPFDFSKPSGFFAIHQDTISIVTLLYHQKR